MSHDPVPVVSPPALPVPRTLVCANCGADLAGEYCAVCGQRHEPRVHTMAHFAAEAFESITHADSRLWRTLGYLLTRPGYLTKEFFAGRRARYLPPFRLYLVISVVFFLFGLPEGVNLKLKETPTDAAAMEKLRAEAAAQTEAFPRAVQEATAKAMERAAEARSEPAAAGEAEGEDGLNVSITGLDEFCKAFVDQEQSDNQFRNNVRDRCLKIAAGDGVTVWNNAIHMIPRAMFVFLPLLALVMKLLYWRPKRYYVEHLLFLVHNHAFVFLTLAILILLGRVPFLGGDWFDYVWLAVILYMAWYIFRAMRNVYAQGRALTFAKYTLLGSTYCVATLVMVLITLLYSAFTL